MASREWLSVDLFVVQQIEVMEFGFIVLQRRG